MPKTVLTFSIDSHICAVEIESVLEVLNFGTPTPIPCALPYIEGLIYSRNQGLTVINLRKKFGLAEKKVDKNTKVIVIEIHKKTEQDDSPQITLYGLVADEVLDVITVENEELLKNGATKLNIPKQNIAAIYKSGTKNIILLDFSDL